MEITEQQYKEWNNAIINAGLGSNISLKQFQLDYPDLYRHMTSMLRKRTKLNKAIAAMTSMSPYLYWGSLTFNEEEEIKEEKTKRKQAIRFLNRFFRLWLMVEEYGTEGGRYHIHFLAVLKDYTDYEVIRSKWHSFVQIELLKTYDYKRKVKYLTKYAVKQVPRIRLSKRTALLLKDYMKRNGWLIHHFNFYETEYFRNNDDVIDLPF